MMPLSKNNFNDEIQKGKCIVIFTAPWDIKFPQVLEDLQRIWVNWKIYTVDFDEEMDLVNRYSVRDVPKMLVFRSGALAGTIDSINSTGCTTTPKSLYSPF